MKYTEYTTTISNDPSYYGSECSQSDADRIAADLTKMVQAEFPGISVSTSGSRTTGPVQEVVDEINGWIGDNWTASL